MNADYANDYGVSAQSVVSFLSLFAVPFYFLSAGYFLVRKIEQPVRTSLNLALRLLPIFLFWALLYRFMYGPGLTGFADPVTVVKFMLAPSEGYHLWFLPALGISSVLVLFLLRYGGMGAVFIIAVPTFVLAVSFSSYGAIVCQEFDCWNTRNGPFLGLIYVALGAWLGREGAMRFSNKGAAALVIFGLGVMIFEALMLNYLEYKPFILYEIGFGVLPYATGIFLLAVNFDKDWRGARWLAFLGPCVLGMYAIHALILREIQGAFPALDDGFLGALFVAGIVIVLSAGVSLALSRIPLMRRVVS